MGKIRPLITTWSKSKSPPLILLAVVSLFLPMTAKAACNNPLVAFFVGNPQNTQLISLANSELGFNITSDSKINLCSVPATTILGIDGTLQILKTGRTILSGNTDSDDLFFKQLQANQAGASSPDNLLGIVVHSTGDYFGHAAGSLSNLYDVPDELMQTINFIGFFEQMKVLPRYTILQKYVINRESMDYKIAWDTTYEEETPLHTLDPAGYTLSCSGLNWDSAQGGSILPEEGYLECLNQNGGPNAIDAFHAYAESVYQAYVTSKTPTTMGKLKIIIVAELEQASETTSPSPASTPSTNGFWGTAWGSISNIVSSAVNTVTNLFAIKPAGAVPYPSDQDAQPQNQTPTNQPVIQTVTQTVPPPSAQQQKAAPPPTQPQSANVSPQPQPITQTQTCGETLISFPQNGATYSLSDPNFPFNSKNMRGIVFSTKNPMAYYETRTYGENTTNGYGSAGVGGISELVGYCSNNVVIGGHVPIDLITEPGKYYWIIYRADNIPGVKIDNQCYQGVCWKEIIEPPSVSATLQNEWLQYVRINGPAPTDDYYVSTITVIK